ncbi:MAG: nucleotidyltransferase family protein, partial [Mycoplasmataceae bacterium]|nr:nucleotidyltransferase family protein [Mycoplasmataceae bacterium]
MKKIIIGIIVEFNPLHNGHKKLIDDIKTKHPKSIIIAVMSGQFVQRGELAIYNKWVRAEAALDNGVDLVIEIPVHSVLNHGNIFAKKSIEILNTFKVTNIYFGSEDLDINKINSIVDFVLKNEEKLEELKKEFHSLPKAFESLLEKKIKSNDMLGICYILEARKSKLKIKFNRIKRKFNNKYTTSSEIRKLIKEKKNSNKSLIHNYEYMNLENYSDII